LLLFFSFLSFLSITSLSFSWLSFPSILSLHFFPINLYSFFLSIIYLSFLSIIYLSFSFVFSFLLFILFSNLFLPFQLFLFLFVLSYFSLFFPFLSSSCRLIFSIPLSVVPRHFCFQFFFLILPICYFLFLTFLLPHFFNSFLILFVFYLSFL
jgi:hypothetical protein